MGKLVPVNCSLCGDSRRKLLFTEKPFSVVRCLNCGLTYISPRIAANDLIKSVYNAGYWKSQAPGLCGYTDYRADEQRDLRTFRKTFFIIRKYFPQPGSLLDVGCAAGYFLTVAREKGWKIKGFEPSDDIRQEAIRRLGKGIVFGDRLEKSFPSGNFDLVTLWNVIEHVPDPISTLKHIRKLLAPNGKILIQTENVSSLAARFLGRRWHQYKHAEHLFHFNPETISLLLSKCGFEIVENRSDLGGKYVAFSFVIERSSRIHKHLPSLLAPLQVIKDKAVYINFHDEMTLMVRPKRYKDRST